MSEKIFEKKKIDIGKKKFEKKKNRCSTIVLTFDRLKSEMMVSNNNKKRKEKTFCLQS
jgi:hypothetical protein